MSKDNFLDATLQIINVGLESFASDLKAFGTEVIHVDWRPPAKGDPYLNTILKAVESRGEVIDAANKVAIERMLAAHPVFVDVGSALETIPGFTPKTILHAGPPVTWENMCGPMQGAIIGALMHEGRATDEAQAREAAASGEYTFAPCHHYDAVGPMTGVISASMPVIVVEDKNTGRRVYSNFNGEGKGKKALSFGAFGPDVEEIQVWLRDVFAPFLKQVVYALGGIDLKAIMARALQMGDEVHNRHVAATSLLVREIFTAMSMVKVQPNDLVRIGKFLYYNDFVFLNFSMAACKLMTLAAHDVPNSTLLTAISRNGVETGIRVSGLGDRWFTAPAPQIKGLYFPGFTADDANPDIGDSAITETAGVGGFALAAGIGLVKMVGGTAVDAIAYTKEMGEITLARSPMFLIPVLEFEGTPTGVDIRRTVETGISPVINTGIAHRKAGIGMVGAGITRVPMECFAKALSAFADRPARG
ncbi:MAG: hypothetical protein FD169_572 [Bacillota bacterium]|nr:MAG: hypothetical protein FD169_572 [Bacillota bacterium]